MRSDNRSRRDIISPLSSGRRLLPLIVRSVLCASERSIVIYGAIIGGLRIRIFPDHGKLHGQTPSSAIKGDGLHVVIKYRNDDVAHTPVLDDDKESRLLIFLNSVIAAGDRYFDNDVWVSQAHWITVQSLHVGLDIER